MRRIVILGGLLFILVFLSLATLNGVLLTLTMPLLLYLGLDLLFTPTIIHVKVQRTLDQRRVLPGSVVQNHLIISNEDKRLKNVLIEDFVPSGLKIVEGTTSLLTALAPGETTELSYSVQAPRGIYHFNTVQISAGSYFNLFEHKTKISAQAHLFVQPDIARIRRIAIQPRGTNVYAGYIPARKGGPGVDFFGVREYKDGDPMRWVNWRASARLQQTLFVNQFEQERVADVGLIVDTRLRSEITTPEHASLFEYSIEAAASLAERFLADGNRVGLLLYGTHLDWTLPGYGKVQRERILKSLARARTGESLIFENLENLPAQLLPPNSQLVLISPLQNADLPVLIRLRARGYAVLVISPNPISFEMAHMRRRDENVALAKRLAHVERSLMLRRLRQAGVRVLDWDVTLPLDVALQVGLSRPASWIRSMGTI